MGNGLKQVDGRVLLCVTCDVEDSDIESLGLIKEACDRYTAPVTWFVEPGLCREPAALNLLREYCNRGDEVGLHNHWKGSLELGLRNVSDEQIRTELEEATQLLRPHYELESFRGGGLCQTTVALEFIRRKGFRFDSSVACGLNEPEGWYQEHSNILPLSAYFPSSKGYDVVSHEDSSRLDILEIPVTRGSPCPRLWCNMLEPDITPLLIMKAVFEQYHIRRHFQPLVIMVVILHSWSPRRRKTMTRDLDNFLKYARARNVDFRTLAKAGNQWKAIWEHQPAARNALLWHGYSLDLKTRFLATLIKLVIFAHNWKQDPAYYPKLVMSKSRNRGNRRRYEPEDGGKSKKDT